MSPRPWGRTLMPLGMEQRKGCCTHNVSLLPLLPGAGPGPALMTPPKERSRDTWRRASEGTFSTWSKGSRGPRVEENAHRVVSMGGVALF